DEPIQFAKGTVTLPEDPATVTLFELHDHMETYGRAVSVTETDRGIEASFEIAKTKAGDVLLSQARDPDTTKRPRLSAELRGLVRKGTEAIASSLRNAAVVPEGAFQSAALFALAPGEEITTELDVDPDQILEKLQELKDQITEIASAIDPTTEEAPASSDDTEGDTPEDTPEEDDMADAVIPEGLNPPADETKKKKSADGLFAALAYAGRTKDNSVLAEYAEGSDALFAISNIQHSGPASVTIGADTQVPQFVGELWAKRPYERKFLPLFNSQDLTGMKVMGWKWDPAKTPAVDEYSGNVAEIPSNAVDTIPVEETAKRVAGGHKLDRRFIDFGDSGVYASYFAQMTESYSRHTDNKVLTLANAGASTVTPGTVPSGIAKGLAAVVDGALAVIASENTPRFAVVSPELWRDILLTERNEVLGYLSASLGLEDGDLGGFRLLPGSVGTGKVLVGAKEAATVYELPGVPIRVEGIDPHHGAIDPALFGYYAFIINNAAALASVTVAA
ncbi:MAG: hypothetical protein J0H64_03750, partial [Actinobacteria bacterium]|nr:hypothetical protein [Actinomycetota bacterium]